MSDIDTFDTGFGVIDKLPTMDMLRPASTLTYQLHDKIKEAIYNPINDAQQAYAVYQAKIQQAIADQLAQAATAVDGIHEVITNDISTKLNTSAETVAGYVSKYDGGSNQLASDAPQAPTGGVATATQSVPGSPTNTGGYYVYQPRCPTNRTCYLLLAGETPQDQSDYPHGPYPSFDDAYTALIGLCGLQATGCANGSNGQLGWCVWRCNNGVGGYFYEVQPSDQDLSSIQGCTRLSCWPTSADADVEKARLEGTSGGGGNGGGNGDGGGGGGGNGTKSGWLNDPGPMPTDSPQEVPVGTCLDRMDSGYDIALYPFGTANPSYRNWLMRVPPGYDKPATTLTQFTHGFETPYHFWTYGFGGGWFLQPLSVYRPDDPSAKLIPATYDCQDTGGESGAPKQCPFPACLAPASAITDCQRVEICNWPQQIINPPPPIHQGNGKLPDVALDKPKLDQPKDVDGEFWNPCSPEWCASLEQDLQGFSAINEWFKAWIKGATNRDVLHPKPIDTGSTIANAIVHVLVDLPAAIVGDVLKVIVASINEAIGTIAGSISDCNFDAYSGLVASRAVINLFSESILGFHFVLEGYVRLNIDFPQYKERIDALLNYLCPARVPSEGNIVRMYLRDEVSREHAKCLLRLHGFDPGCSEILLDAEREIVDWREVYRYAKLADKDQTWIDRKVGTIGFKDDSDKEILKTLYEEIPGIHDILHFAQTNEDDPDVKARFKLDDEFSRFWKDDYKRWLGIQGVKEDTAKHFWRAHWVRATVEQAQAALRRLRPGRVDPSMEFTGEDFDNVMRENDILPFWRERFKYLGYNPVSIRFIQRLYALGVWDKDAVTEALQDINYKEEDAKALADTLEIQKKRTDATTGRGWTVSAVASAYKQGLMTASELTGILKDQGYTDEQISALVDRVERELRIDLQRKVITDAHKCYVGGYTDDRETRYVLSGIQVSPDRINDYMALWNVEIECKGKLITAAQLQDYAKRGLISRDELISRLERLGYDNDSIGLLLAAIDDTLRNLAAKQMDIQTKLADKAAKEAAKQAEKAAKQAQKQAADLLKQAQKCAHKGIRAKLLRDRAKLLASLASDPVKASAIIDKAEVEATAVEADAAVDGCPPGSEATT